VGALVSAIALKRQGNPLPVAAHPAGVAGGDAGHEGKVGHVLVDHRTGCDKGMGADGYPADDGAVGTQGCAFAHQGGAVLLLAGNCGAGVVDVGECHGRAAENIVFQGDVVKDGAVVLDFDVIADDDLVAYKDVLAQGAVVADMGAGADVGPVPDACSVADLGAVIYDGGFVDEDCVGHGISVPVYLHN